MANSNATSCPYCLCNADAGGCSPEFSWCGIAGEGYSFLVREWAQRTNRDDRASTLGATRVPGNVYRYWPDPTNDEAELDAWLFRTSAQRWCVGVGWGFELLRDQVAATEARDDDLAVFEDVGERALANKLIPRRGFQRDFVAEEEQHFLVRAERGFAVNHSVHDGLRQRLQ